LPDKAANVELFFSSPSYFVAQMMSEKMPSSTQMPGSGSKTVGRAEFTDAVANLSNLAALDVGGSINQNETTPPPHLLPMREFDPSQPAILRDRRTDSIETWTGEEAANFIENSVARPDGTVEWSGFVFDGWDEVLGG
jgi:hypothetical protein